MPIPIAAALIASAVVAAGTATASAVTQKKANDEQRRYNQRRQSQIDAKAAQENAWYRMQYYQDPLRTSQMANMLKSISDYNQRMIERQQSLGLITGATHEQTVATMGQAMQNYGNTVADIKANDDQRKNSIATAWQSALNTQFNRQQSLDDATHAQRQQSFQNAVNNINNFGSTAQSAIAMAAGPGKGNNYDPNDTQNATSQVQQAADVANMALQSGDKSGSTPWLQGVMQKENIKNNPKVKKQWQIR